MMSLHEENLRHLMAFRNEWKLYKRKCDFTGESIISAYDTDTPFPVYKNEIWWSDQWNALDYGRDFDFSRPFFDQFKELQNVVPREGTSIFNSENCDYNSHTRESRNCYLNSLVYRAEDLDYSYWVSNGKDSMDCYLILDSQLCYWAIDSQSCYHCFFIQECYNCSDCFFSFQLRGCKNCLFCTNLANKEYHIHNQPCTKEEFEAKKAEIFNGSRKTLQEALQKFQELKLNTIHRATHCINCENSLGDHATNLKNCDHCFESYNSENCSHSISTQDSHDIKECYSAGWPACDGIYKSVVTRGSTDIAFCIYTFFSSGLMYCDGSNDLHDSFGCIGLQHKRNCILNKQYSKDQYDELLPKIIEHMKKTGEWEQFFPPSLSVFAYNESAAQDYFPLTQQQAESRDYRWKAKDEKEYREATISELPDNIKNVPSTITNEILACASSGKNYKIQARELEFYKRHNLPIPANCPEVRHKFRAKMRNPLQLFTRTCSNCQKSIQSSYTPTRPETVYCEECFLAAVK